MGRTGGAHDIFQIEPAGEGGGKGDEFAAQIYPAVNSLNRVHDVQCRDV